MSNPNIITTKFYGFCNYLKKRHSIDVSFSEIIFLFEYKKISYHCSYHEECTLLDENGVCELYELITSPY